MNATELSHEIDRVWPYERKLQLQRRFWDEVAARARIVTVRLSPRKTLFLRLTGSTSLTRSVAMRGAEVIATTTSHRQYFEVMDRLLAEEPMKMSDELVAEVMQANRPFEG